PLSIADRLEHHREEATHLHDHAELGGAGARGDREHPTSGEEPERQAAHPFHPHRYLEDRHSQRHRANRAVPTFTRARMRSFSAIRPSIATISGFHSTYPLVSVSTHHTVSGAAAIVALMTNSNVMIRLTGTSRPSP